MHRTTNLHTGAPEDLAHWGLHAFCLGARIPPQRVIRLDDNGRILWRAGCGAARDDLGGSDSQIALLTAFDLIEERGGRWFAQVPALAMAGVRERLADWVGDLPQAVAGALAAMAADLDRIGCGAHAAAVLFGLGLDGRFWDVLRGQGLVPDTALTVAHPFWRGAVWAVWPPMHGAAGLNHLAPAGVDARLCMVWTEATLAAQRALAACPGTETALRGVSGPVLDLPEGRIPVLRPGDGADALAWALGGRLAAHLTADVAALAGDDLPPDLDPATLRVCLGHELIWHLAAPLHLAKRDPLHGVYVWQGPA